MGAIVDFRDFRFGQPFPPKGLQSSSTPVEGQRPCREPAFHKTIVITVPLGPTRENRPTLGKTKYISFWFFEFAFSSYFDQTALKA